MYRHATETQGDKRSPTRAAFQKTPRNPVRWESSKPGARSLTYVHAQMKSKRVVMKDLKSNSALMGRARRRGATRWRLLTDESIEVGVGGRDVRDCLLSRDSSNEKCVLYRLHRVDADARASLFRVSRLSSSFSSVRASCFTGDRREASTRRRATPSRRRRRRSRRIRRRATRTLSPLSECVPCDL